MDNEVTIAAGQTEITDNPAPKWIRSPERKPWLLLKGPTGDLYYERHHSGIDACVYIRRTRMEAHAAGVLSQDPYEEKPVDKRTPLEKLWGRPC